MSQFLNSLAEAELKRRDPAVGAALASIMPKQAPIPAPLLPLPERTIDIEPEGASGSVGLDEVASRLWRRRITLFTFAAMGILLAMMWTALSKPVYRARTSVRLEMPPNPYSALSAQSSSPNGEVTTISDSYLQNEMKVLQSDALAERVGERIDGPTQISLAAPSSSPFTKLLAYIRRGQETYPAEEARIRYVRKALTVRPSLKSQVVDIYFDSSDPARAAMGANTVVSEYIAMSREAQVKSAHDTTEWLSSQISDLKVKLEHENGELKAFATAAGLLYSANQNVLAEQRVSDIQAQLAKAEEAREASRSRYDTAISNPPELLPDGSENALLHNYEANLASAERDLIQLRSVYTPENYKVVDAESRVTQIQASIQRERKNMIERLRAQYDSAARLQRSIAAAYTSQTQKLQSQSADIFRYNTLKHELDTTQQLYDSLSQKIKEAEIASSLQTTNVRLIDVARPPVRPYSPSRPLAGVIGLGSGLFIGVITVLIRGRGSMPASGATEERLITMRELGSIPDAARTPYLKASVHRALPWKREPAELAMASWHTQSPLTESFSSTITSILFSPGFKHRRVLAVSSVEPQEGKTTIIANLAILLAETYGRVLLIDGDLRRPGLHRIFDQCNDSGLTTLLTGDQPLTKSALDRVVLTTKVQNLFLLSSGPGIPSVTPILHSPRVGQLLALARDQFDFVLIDTPPTSLFSDARLLAKLADSVVVVFDADRASRNAVSTAYRQFLEDGTNVLGAIRNRADQARRSYEYYKSYDSA